MPNPIQPYELPAPVRVGQQASMTCWAACFRSLTMTNGSSLRYSEGDLLRIFSQFAQSAQSGISAAGAFAEGHTLGMTAVASSGAHFSLRNVCDGLQRGYCLLAYNIPGSSPPTSHMVIIYGVNPKGIKVMNPDPFGMNFFTIDYLRSSSYTVLFTPIFPTLAAMRVGNPFRELFNSR